MSAQNFQALLINLDRDHDRLNRMHAQLARARIGFTRLPAIEGDKVPQDLRPYFFRPDGKPRTGMKRGELGCYASHLLALTRIASGELGDAVLVMEDDLDIVPDFIALLEQTRRVLPADWNIVRLSNPPRRAYVPLTPLPNERYLVRYSRIPNSAGAYLINPAGARKFLTHGVRGLTFDDDLRRPWFHEMNSFGIVPPPIRAGVAGPSSIDAMESGRFDKGVSPRRERFERGDYAHSLRRLIYNGETLGWGNRLACAALNAAEMLIEPLTGFSLIHRAARLFPGSRHV